MAVMKKAIEIFGMSVTLKINSNSFDNRWSISKKRALLGKDFPLLRLACLCHVIKCEGMFPDITRLIIIN